MNILFWNIKKKANVTTILSEIIREENIDIVAFAEFPLGSVDVFKNELLNVNPSFNYLTPFRPGKVEIFYIDGTVDIVNSYNGKRISVNKVHSNIDNEDYYFVFCHLKDALMTDRAQLPSYARFTVKEIINFENEVRSKRTIVCGDFNMNPYEQAMLEVDGFNAMLTSSIALKRTRNVEGQSYEMFYNPMWGLFGDLHNQDVSGTFYHAPGEPIQQFWHIIDQVIMRPDVIPVFDKQQLKIVTKGQNYNLLNRNNNISNHYSDHLPLKFTLNI